MFTDINFDLNFETVICQ